MHSWFFLFRIHCNHLFRVYQVTSQEKLLDELDLETLKSRRWLRRLCCTYKIINIGIPKYLTDLIPKREIDYNIS